jgi:hypothetical protein
MFYVIDTLISAVSGGIAVWLFKNKAIAELNLTLAALGREHAALKQRFVGGVAKVTNKL